MLPIYDLIIYDYFILKKQTIYLSKCNCKNCTGSLLKNKINFIYVLKENSFVNLTKYNH